MKRHFVILLLDIVLVSFFVVLFTVGTYTRFNYLDIIYKGHSIPLLCIVFLLVLFGLLWRYNKTIGVLYGILILFQLKRIIINGFVVETTIPKTTSFFTEPNLMDPEDDRFKSDDVKLKEIMRQIHSELEFDPYKTPLAREVIIDIYKRYFNNDIFVKLQEITENSKKYQKQYKLLYAPQPTELNYSVDVARLLVESSGFGVNSQIDKPLGLGDTSTVRT